jgi:hypothetical protein
MSGTFLRTRPFLASAVLSACLLGSVSPALAQSDEQRAGARSLATEGAAAFNEGRYKDAVDLFVKAESLMHAPPHLLFAARAHAKLGQFVKAREAYMKVVKEQLAPNAPQAFRDAQTAAEEERKQVEPHIGRLTVKVEGADGAKDLVVAVDGQPIPSVLLGVPQPMDPGDHTITATATGFKAAPVTASLKDAGIGAVTIKMEVDNSVPPPGAPAPGAAAGGAVSTTPGAVTPSDVGKSGSNGMRIGSYVSFGVGAVGAVLGTVFVMRSSSKRKAADDVNVEASGSTTGGPCSIAANTCDADSAVAKKQAGLDDQARSAKTIGIVGYVVGGLGLAGGVTLFILSNKKEESSPASAGFVAPYVGLGAVGVRGAF